MARQVHFDPFGQRLAGYRMGQQDETAMQSNTRQARQADYQFNVEQPLQLNQLRREDQYNEYTQPFRMNAAKRAENMGQFAVPFLQNQYVNNDAIASGNVYDAEAGRLKDYGMRTGDWGRGIVNDMDRYRPTESKPEETHAVNTQRMDAFDAYSGLLEQEGIQPDDPIAMNYQTMMEQMYGLQPGSLLTPGLMAAEPVATQTTPGYQSYTNPYTGQKYDYAATPQSYEQYGFFDRAAQMQAAQAQQQNIGIQQQWQAIKQGGGQAGAEESGPLGYYDGN